MGAGSVARYTGGYLSAVNELGGCCQAAFRLRDDRSANRAAIFIRLLASTASPTKSSKRSRPCSRQRFIPRPRKSTEIRPSMPARKRWPPAKRAALLMRRARRRLATAALRDALGGHARGLTGRDRLDTVEAPITRRERGRAPEERDVMRQRRGDVLIVRGIAVEHAVVGDQAVPALAQEDLVAELHGPSGPCRA